MQILKTTRISNYNLEYNWALQAFHRPEPLINILFTYGDVWVVLMIPAPKQHTVLHKGCSWLPITRTLDNVGSFENEALENKDRSTKHPKLENEAP